MDPTEPPNNPPYPKSPTTVYIFNLSEDVWPFISAMSDPTARQAEITENANLADRDLFSLAPTDNFLFISPRPIDPEFLAYYRSLTRAKNIRVAVTKSHSGTICQDILQDDIILNTIIQAANHTRRLTLLSYSTTPQFLHLASQLRRQNLTIYTPESPEAEDSWTVNFYGSKSGIRQLAQQSSAAEPDLKMPDGLILSGIADAAQIAAWTYLEQKGVVLKTNKGHAGAGLLIFRPSDLPTDYAACTQAILDTLSKDAYWDRFPIIIEDYIPPATTIAGGFPNVEFKILKTGKVEYLYHGGMRIDSTGVFRGMEINHNAVSDQVAAQMIDTGFFVGERYASAGYRGYFDIDFIAAKNGQLYVTESNVRRTGGTHVYNTALELFGRDFMYETYILSHNGYRLSRSFTFPQLLTTLQPILYRHSTKEGIVIASQNLLSQNVLAYIIFGSTKKRALELEHQLETLLDPNH